MFVARRFLEVVVTAGMLVGLVVASGAASRSTPAQPERCRMVSRHPSRAGSASTPTRLSSLLAQERSQRAAHGGRLSEQFQFEAGPGSQFFVSYATPRVPGLRRSERGSPRASRTGRASRSSLASFSRRTSTRRPRPLRT